MAAPRPLPRCVEGRILNWRLPPAPPTSYSVSRGSLYPAGTPSSAAALISGARLPRETPQPSLFLGDSRFPELSARFLFAWPEYCANSPNARGTLPDRAPPGTRPLPPRTRHLKNCSCRLPKILAGDGGMESGAECPKLRGRRADPNRLSRKRLVLAGQKFCPGEREPGEEHPPNSGVDRRWFASR